MVAYACVYTGWFIIHESAIISYYTNISICIFSGYTIESRLFYLQNSTVVRKVHVYLISNRKSKTFDTQWRCCLR